MGTGLCPRAKCYSHGDSHGVPAVVIYTRTETSPAQPLPERMDDYPEESLRAQGTRGSLLVWAAKHANSGGRSQK